MLLRSPIQSRLRRRKLSTSAREDDLSANSKRLAGYEGPDAGSGSVVLGPAEAVPHITPLGDLTMPKTPPPLEGNLREEVLRSVGSSGRAHLVGSSAARTSQGGRVPNPVPFEDENVQFGSRNRMLAQDMNIASGSSY